MEDGGYVNVCLLSLALTHHVIVILPSLMLAVLAARVLLALAATTPPYDAAVFTLMRAAGPVVVLVLIVLLETVLADLFVEHLHAHLLHLVNALSQSYDLYCRHLEVGHTLEVFLLLLLQLGLKSGLRFFEIVYSVKLLRDDDVLSLFG